MEQKENRVVLRGTAAGEATLSHQVHGLDFYRFPLSVPRLSGREDRLNILLPAPPEGKTLPQPGDYLEVAGEVRSFNNRSGVGSRLVLTVFVRALYAAEEDEPDCNRLTLQGTLCRVPVYRRTPLGREISDLTLAVNRRYGRADYLPVIAWGQAASQVSGLAVGDPLSLEGRVQSRIYRKMTEIGPEERVAYEVSVMRLLETPQS